MLKHSTERVTVDGCDRIMVCAVLRDVRLKHLCFYYVVYHCLRGSLNVQVFGIGTILSANGKVTL